MLRMCVCMHSRFIENHPIWILKYGPLIFEVVLSHQHYTSTDTIEGKAAIKIHAPMLLSDGGC
jgi:hypothetical protein